MSHLRWMSVAGRVAVSLLLALPALVPALRAEADCAADPTVSLATTGPDRFGDFTLQVTYSFPDTTSSSQRRVGLGGTGPGFNIGFGSIQPEEASGIWTVSYNSFCWPAGPYPFTATAEACGSRDAEATANIAAPEPSRPTIDVSYDGPDAEGDGTITITYAMPNTRPEQRRIHYSVLPEGSAGGWQEVTATGESGTIVVPYGFTCAAPGKYTIRAATNALCGVEATDSQEVILERDEIQMSVAGPDDDGHVDVTVSWNFKYTKPATERLISRVYVNDNNMQVSDTIAATQASGTHTFRHNTACWRPGTYWISAGARACHRQTDAPQQTVTIVKKEPAVTLRIDEENNKGIVTWSFPGTNSAATDQRDVYVRWHHSEGAFWRPPAPIGKSGSAEFPLPECLARNNTHLVAVAMSCQRDKVETDPQALPECENSCPRPPASFLGQPSIATTIGEVCCVGEPIRLTNGNMRMVDSDPLGGGPFAPRRRIYDSRNATPGWFGWGWVSILDLRIQAIGGPNGRDIVTLDLESGDRVIFILRNGRYVQVYPAVQRAPGTLTYNGTFTYRDDRVIREFGTNSRLVRLKSLDGLESVDLTYNSSGRPMTVEDSNGVWRWEIGFGSNNKVETINVTGGPGAGLWRYTQSGVNELLTRVTSPAGLWRTYTYGPHGLESAVDGAGHLIESHTYDAAGRALTSYGGSDEVASITYDLPGRVAGERLLRVTRPNGRTTDYYSRYIVGSARIVEVSGSCDCGTDDAVLVFDGRGRIIRQQDAHGYVAVRTYDDATERVTFEQSRLRPAGCDPETDPGQCRLDPDSLRDVLLVPTSVSRSMTYTYGDPGWPDRPTTVVTESVTGSGRTVTTTAILDAATGQPLNTTTTGWTGDPLQQQSRTVSAVLYDGAEGAAFAPGGAFAAEWLSLPQPRGRRKTVDGPHSDVSDVTAYVHYPVHGAVPSHLRGRLAAVRNAAGHITRSEDYDLFGNVTRSVSADGTVTTATFDPLGRLLTSTLAGVPGCDTTADPLCATSLTSTSSYLSGTGPLQKQVQPSGGVTVYTYDSRGRVERIERGFSEVDLRERIETTYDPATTHKASESTKAFENGSWVEKTRQEFTYDSFGRLQRTTHADGTFTAYAYGTDGDLASVQDENHATPNTLYRYDAAGRVAAVIQTLATVPGGTITTSHTYDLGGNLLTVTDPNGNVTRYTYGDFGEALRQESPVTGVTTQRYDRAGNLIESTDANGVVRTRIYDALGRVTSSAATRGAQQETVVWTYDTAGAGRLLSVSDPSGSTAYQYARHGMVSRETRTIGGSTYGTRYTYDRDGNRERLVYPSGRVAQTTFDYAGRATAVALDGAAVVSSVSYMPFGPAREIVYGNGTRRQMTFDSRYRPMTNALTGPSGTIASYGYGYDPAGNVTRIDDLVDTAYNRAFAYDDLGRLTSANGGTALWGAGTYSYDRMGNLLSMQLGGVSRAFEYRGTTPVITASTENGIRRVVAHDAVGNETALGSAMSTYSPASHLERAGGFEYGYDGRGVRVSTTALEATFVSLTPDQPSPQRVETLVTWTAAATGGSAPLEYQFSRRPAGGTWAVTRAWSTTPTWAWRPTVTNTGTWEFMAEVRSGSTGAAQSSRTAVMEFVPHPPITSATMTADKPSPQRVETLVTWNAAATGGVAPLEYRFIRRLPDGTLGYGTWSATPAYSVRPAVTQPGVWEVHAEVRSSGAINAQTATPAVAIDFVPHPAITIHSWTPDKPSPQRVETTVTWTASASGGVAPLEYAFGRRRAGVTTWSLGAFGTSPSFAWRPGVADAGTWEIRVDVRSSGAIAAQASQVVTMEFVPHPEVTIESLTPDKPSPQRVESSVTFTAAASGGVAPLSWQFSRRRAGTTAWVVAQNYGTANTWRWVTSVADAGTWEVLVSVRSSGAIATQATRTATFELQPHPEITIDSFTTDKPSPQRVETQVAWTATASGGVAPLAYQYKRRKAGTTAWTSSRLYDTNATWSWRPVVTEAGTWEFLVEVRSSGANVTQTSQLMTYEFVPHPEITIDSLTADKPSPQRVETLITFTGIASGGVAPLQYQWKRRKTGETTWTIARLFGPDAATLTWRPAVTDTGTWELLLEVRSNGAAAVQTSQMMTMEIVPHPAVTIDSFTTDKPSPQRVETNVIWTASASGGVAPLQYQYKRRKAGTATWTVAQLFGTTATWAWKPVVADAGTWEILVEARSSGAIAPQASQMMSMDFVPHPAITIESMTSDKPSPQRVEANIFWSASASGGVAPLEFRYHRRKAGTTTWNLMTHFGTTATWTWPTVPGDAGAWEIMVEVRSNGAGAAQVSQVATMELIPHPEVTIDSFTADAPSPQRYGTSITWTALASGGTAPLVYQFFWRDTNSTQWTAGRLWSTANSWTWATSSSQVGTKEVRVQIRGSGAIQPQATATAAMHIVAPAVATALTADRPSPIPIGAATTFSATATPGTLPIEYQFERLDGTQWSVVQPYGPSPTYTWTPQSADAGNHELKVLVRGVGSTDPYDSTRSLSFSVESAGAFLTDGAPPVALAISAPVVEESSVLDGGTTHSVYGPNLELLAEAGVTNHEYLWLNGAPLAQVDTATGELQYYFNDHLGTPILQTDQTATVTWRAEYEPYGEVFALRAGATRHQPLRFPGQEANGPDGLSYNVFRWYRAGWGRYTQADPIGLRGGSNLYAYGAGSPANYIDPFGLDLYVPGPPPGRNPLHRDNVPPGCTAGTWTYADHSRTDLRNLREWSLVQATELGIPVWVEGEMITSGRCVCKYQISGLLRVTRLFERWRRTIYCCSERFDEYTTANSREYTWRVPSIGAAPGTARETRTTTAPVTAHGCQCRPTLNEPF